ncbi:fungal specific transcription factor domain-containing [Pyrenophora seminiperda CCB06]|uniref:Fungal specific transcription factor domain-containing n=1 Tax=Pyrenophora seminiperda CCB06 TaxID=1302712 RepID=A0A3M7M793_9PLEO|nr:fungal specific transcription factor domain-containing [Pyrenophora seminiperda CCB06]
MSASSSSTQNGAHGLSKAPPPSAVEQKLHPRQPRIRRRNRLITSCLECRRRKLKCDKGNPCTHCTKTDRKCVFIASGMDADAQAKLAEVKEQMGMLEKSLEEGVARKTESSIRATSEFSRLSVLPGQEQLSDQEDEEDTRDLCPTYLVTEDAAYYEPEEDFNDDMVDLGFRIGKLRITDRIGGLVRPKFSDELAQSLSKLPLPVSPSRSHIDEESTDWLAPTSDYVAPSSNFMLASGVDRALLEAHLPARAVVDRLIDNYWVHVHPIARTVHRPSFERQYQNFWIRVNMGMYPRSSFQAVLFAALLSSVVSMDAHTVRTDYGAEKRALVDSLREGAEAALAKANFLRTTKLETLQAFVMYLIPLCRNEVSRAHSALVGSLIRLAECMGLHRDPATYINSPIEIQVRRLIWYQICFLDIRTCDAVGPRPQIRLDDYDTQFPLNIDDAELDRVERGESEIDVSRDSDHFTDITISRMRFEGYEMHRFIWSERTKLDRKRADGKREVTITSLLSRTQSFQAAMEKKYLPMLGNSDPLHVLASELHGIVSNRLYISVLQRYITSARSKMPERLRQLTMSAATMILEHGMAVEQDPVLSAWSWIVGALHQHHSALLLINEVYVAKLDPAMEQRIWRCLDYSFNLPGGLPNIEKTRLVLEELIGKTKKYSAMKGIRAPNKVPHANLEEVCRGESANRGISPSAPSSTDTVLHSLTGNLGQPQFVPSRHLKDHLPHVSALASGLNTFPGAIPNVSWGSFDMPASFSASPLVSQQPMFSGSTDSAVQQATSNHSSPNLATYAGFMVGSMGSDTIDTMDTMDAINDIDWNDVERMFGSAELGAGNMLIPPFTFPQFSASHLRAPSQDGIHHSLQPESIDYLKH